MAESKSIFGRGNEDVFHGGLDSNLGPSGASYSNMPEFEKVVEGSEDDVIVDLTPGEEAKPANDAPLAQPGDDAPAASGVEEKA